MNWSGTEVSLGENNGKKMMKANFLQDLPCSLLTQRVFLPSHFRQFPLVPSETSWKHNIERVRYIKIAPDVSSSKTLFRVLAQCTW